MTQLKLNIDSTSFKEFLKKTVKRSFQEIYGKRIESNPCYTSNSVKGLRNKKKQQEINIQEW